MFWRYGGEGATHKIWPGPMQRFPRNLSLWTMDGRLRHDSSSADKVKQGFKSESADTAKDYHLMPFQTILFIVHMFSSVRDS